MFVVRNTNGKYYCGMTMAGQRRYLDTRKPKWSPDLQQAKTYQTSANAVNSAMHATTRDKFAVLEVELRIKDGV